MSGVRIQGWGTDNLVEGKLPRGALAVDLGAELLRFRVRPAPPDLIGKEFQLKHFMEMKFTARILYYY